MGQRKAFLTIFVFLYSCLFLTGCLAKRDFLDPKQRVTQHTAYTLAKGQVRTGIGLVGQQSSDLGVRMDLAVGLSDHVDIGANIGHAAFGVVNVYGDFNFLDFKHFALGSSLNFVWIKPSIIWILPDDIRSDLGDINILSIPLELVSSYPINNWLQFDLAAGYTWSKLSGEISSETELIDSSIGTRQLYLRPAVQFHIASRANLFIRGKLLLHGVFYDDVTTRTDVTEGIVVTTTSQEWKKLSFDRGSDVSAGIQVKFYEHTYMTLWMTYNGAFSRSNLIDSPVLPGVDILWRF